MDSEWSGHAADDFCRDRVRRHDRDRFLTALFLPGAERSDVLAVYAFNIEIAAVREMVGEPLAGLVRLQWWRDALDGICGGTPPAHPVAEALSLAVRRRRLGRSCFETAIDARAGDIEGRQPPTPAALEAYAAATSAGINALVLEILGNKSESAAEAGRRVGIAWALTGLMRAVPAHARQRRVYLPESSCRAAGLAVDALLDAAGPVPGLDIAVAEFAGLARRHLAAARALGGRVPRPAAPALLTATLADTYLDRLEKAGFDPFAAERHASAAKAGPAAMLRLAFNAYRGRY
jgi:phytoene synthase